MERRAAVFVAAAGSHHTSIFRVFHRDTAVDLQVFVDVLLCQCH